MAVFRVEKNRGYTVMSNHHLRNKALSLKAKGLLSQMLSLPEDWDYTLKGLSLINRESIDAIRTAVWELEKAGYIRREQGRDPKGKMADMVYTIYEQPVLENPVLENPTSADPVLENPTSDNPSSGNPTQLNKDIQTTYLPKTEKINTDGQSTDSVALHVEVVEAQQHPGEHLVGRHGAVAGVVAELPDGAAVALGQEHGPLVFKHRRCVHGVGLLGSGFEVSFR